MHAALPPSLAVLSCAACRRVEKADLPALEYVMQKKMKTRVNVAVMMGGSGAQVRPCAV